MKKTLSNLFAKVFLVIYLVSPGIAKAQPGSVTKGAGKLKGYVLFAPGNDTNTYLVDGSGNIVHTWQSQYIPGMSVYLFPNGYLLRAENYGTNYCGYPGGRIAMYDSNSVLKWSYVIDSPNRQQTHDIFPMPNGNVLVDVWEKIPAATARKAGRTVTDTDLWCGMVVELHPDTITKSAKEVWRWRFWDHLVSNPDSVSWHPELLNINETGTPNKGLNDWTHMNAVTYNPSLDEVMVSSRNLNEIYIIDHSTSTALSAGHSGGKHGKGGDFLYRWGNSNNYKVTGTQQLFGQHSPYWLPNHKKQGRQIMINNDGFGRGYTSADIIDPPVDTSGNYIMTPNTATLPARTCITYNVPDSLYNEFEGSSQKLADGNTLICRAQKGTFFATDKDGNIIWEYQLNNDQSAFRCTHYDLANTPFPSTPRVAKTSKKK